MSLTILLANTTPINPPPETPAVESADFCRCDFACDYQEKVFADDDYNGITNDFTDFLFRTITPTDTVTIELYRRGVLVATINNDDYGTYYPTFTAQPFYVGWLADWTKIFNAFTGGVYQVKVITRILGVDETFESRLFYLNSYDDKSANRTVKIESFQTGNIESSQFDYNNLIEGGWYSSIRLRGTFGNMAPSIERDIYKDSSYRTIQNRDVTKRKYTLSCELLPESLVNRLATFDMLANEIKITSYDLLQELKYEQYPVVPDSFEDPNYLNNGTANFIATMADRQENIIKRNF